MKRLIKFDVKKRQIPHACGFRPPELIKTPEVLKREIELLELLADIEIAIKTMKQVRERREQMRCLAESSKVTSTKSGGSQLQSA